METRRDEWRQDKTKTISKKIVTMGDETNGDKMDWR